VVVTSRLHASANTANHRWPRKYVHHLVMPDPHLSPFYNFVNENPPIMAYPAFRDLDRISMKTQLTRLMELSQRRKSLMAIIAERLMID
jgi:hypothetical protein